MLSFIGKFKTIEEWDEFHLFLTSLPKLDETLGAKFASHLYWKYYSTLCLWEEIWKLDGSKDKEFLKELNKLLVIIRTTYGTDDW